MEITKCINCETEVSDKFCSHCGQRVGVKRLTFREGWNDFWARVYGFDGMFPRTLRDLTIRPGVVAQRFLNGNRIMYYRPVGYFFFIITLYILVYSTFSIDMEAFMSEVAGNIGGQQSKNQQQLNSSIMNWVNDNQRAVAFLLIPFYMFWAKLLFRKQKLNWLEHGVLIFYTQGHMQWISILSLATFSVFSFAPSFYWMLLIGMIYYSFGCMQLYDTYTRWSAFWRGVLVNVLFFISFVVVITVLMTIVVLRSPELMEMIKPAATGG